MNINEIEVVCPLYNAYNRIDRLLKGLFSQKNIIIKRILFIITDTNDNVESKLQHENVSYYKIKQSEFNHAFTREKAILSCTCKYVIMCTDDVVFIDEYALSNLVSSMITNGCQFSYGRQICNNNTIEKYTRMINYPIISRVITKEDINEMQIKAFFCSDAFACYDLDIFRKINGYDEKLLPTSEDMYYARKILLKGYKIFYCSDALVEHSHQFTLRQIYRRYYLIGRFFKENPDFKTYKSMDSGLKLAFEVSIKALKDFNIVVLFTIIPNMTCRYFGKRLGEK